MERLETKVMNGKNSVDKLPMEYKYMGYTIRQAAHPTPANPNRMAWDIYDGVRVRKGNISTLETAKHVIDVMLKYGYWKAM